MDPDNEGGSGLGWMGCKIEVVTAMDSYMEPLHQDDESVTMGEAEELLPELISCILHLVWDSYDLHGTTLTDDIRELSRIAAISKRYNLDLAAHLASRAVIRPYVFVVNGFSYLPLIHSRNMLVNRLFLGMNLFGGENDMAAYPWRGKSLLPGSEIYCTIGIRECLYRFDGPTLSRIYYSRYGVHTTEITAYKKGSPKYDRALTGFPLFLSRFLESLFPITELDNGISFLPPE